MASSWGRNRQSIHDIEQNLIGIFEDIPSSHTNNAGERVIPADALPDVFHAFTDIFNGVELMTSGEMTQLQQLLASNPGIEVTPQMVVGFIAMRTTHSPHGSPEDSPNEDHTVLPERGRGPERDGYNSRSSSNDSVGTAYRSASRPSSRGPPQTPTSRTGPSPFDASKRQRSTPLGSGSNPPSTWSKRPPPSRRKSDAGSHSRALSDSESSSGPPSTWNRTPGGRTRAPSNPTSPYEMDQAFSPPAPHSRPSSRQSRQNQNYHFGSSPPPDSGSMSPDDSLIASISSLPMPRHASDSDSDSEGEDTSLGLVMDRSAASSTVSLEPMERLEALQRANADLGRKLVDAERTLQNKLSDHEMELEEMQSRLDEVRSELSATKREEKELRSKERTNMTQIAALESEIAKQQKSLENARSAYASLQKQYQEQCAESERYRNQLRRRDQEIKDYQDQASLQSLENSKWAKEQSTWEERIAHLETELSLAQQAHAQLDEQKQENLMLKETIDRMRFDMDEMRAAAASGLSGSSAGGSLPGTMSKSLGEELRRKYGGKDGEWGMEGEEGKEGEVQVQVQSPTETEEDEEDEGTEDEDVVQTIITRKKKKVASRATSNIQTRTFQEIKEYSDAATQHDPSEYCVSRNQQTDPEPKPRLATYGVQTDPPPAPPKKAEMQIQTDVVEEPAPTREGDESMASSSATLAPVPQTPADLPPAYSFPDDLQKRIVTETLEQCHPGLKLPVQPVPAGVPAELADAWQKLKDLTGANCALLDQQITTSARIPSAPNGAPAGHRRKGSRFYNIYNTYIIPSKDSPMVQTTAMCVGAVAAFAVFAVSPYLMPRYSVPGGPTYYDRVAWQSFNGMQPAGEGFAPDGSAALWNVLGRVGGGAARIVQGWPT